MQAADLRVARDGDPCPRCGHRLGGYRGIEVGHVFFLGTKYSSPMRCSYLDEQGREAAMVMGCYGIGISRIMAAAVEQISAAAAADTEGLGLEEQMTKLLLKLDGVAVGEDTALRAAR